MINVMAYSHCTGPGTGAGTGMGKRVCNPLVPGPPPCPVPGIGVMFTVKGVLFKPIITGPSLSSIPVPGAVQYE